MLTAAAARLKKSYPVYDSCIIAAGTYPGQEEDVSTVGVKAVLLASDSFCRGGGGTDGTFI
ncbi:MAG: TAXI family TRAP transporter solute-binding subunit [Gallintestinimicrobium sp.]